MQELLRLEPIFHEKIWGGTKLREVFNYPIPSNSTGECWGISAHPHGDCRITNGPLAGMRLSEVYAQYPGLFNYMEYPQFPLLVKIIDSKDDLSVQVHPDDTYAKRIGEAYGKSECWYVLSCDEEAEIVYGHQAQTKEELEAMITRGSWDQLLRRVKIKPGDFFYIPAGTVHALGKGALILEVQQSSDTTYRLYDYDRLDEKGQKRPLHLQEALEVITVPFTNHIINPMVITSEGITKTRYLSTNYFTVEKWAIEGRFCETNSRFKLVSVIEGEGEVNGHSIMKGDHFILTAYCQTLRFSGTLSLIVTYIE